MAKRFTDTDKWKRGFFTDLNYKGKLAWIYLLDNCDHTGIWHINFSLMSFQVGFKVYEADLFEWFGEKIQIIEGDKVFIESFIEFQYGELNPENNAHKPVLKLLEKLAPMKDLRSPSGSAQDKDKDQDKEKEERREKQKFDFDAVYSLYPRQEGKTKGIELCVSRIKTHADFDLLVKAVNKYAKECRDERREKKYIKLFSSFMSVWRDYAQNDPKSFIGPSRAPSGIPKELETPDPRNGPLNQDIKKLLDKSLGRSNDDPKGAA